MSASVASNALSVPLSRAHNMKPDTLNISRFSYAKNGMNG